ncbi:MAG TPA: SDR family NAD(P)-dependent oxidoreductase [Thermoleophilaceae bacterium]
MSEDFLRDRVALVTGASGGIGRALSLRLAQAGARVALHYASGDDRARQLVDEIGAERASAFGYDLARAESAAELMKEVADALGPVDVLVANAGASKVQEYQDVTVEDWDRIMAVNLRAPFLLAQAALPGMRERGFGRVLFVSSVAAYTGGVVGPHYAASKAGLLGMMRFLASRTAADGVTVNAIAPALIEDTQMLPGDPGDLAQRIPVGRLGKPGEVADLALALLRNGYVTNEAVLIDGGLFPH